MMRIANWSFRTVAVALSTTACGIATTAGVEYRPDVDFGIYSTFAWDVAAIGRSGDVRLENNPFFEDRLFGAVERELSTKGIRRDEFSPELLLHYHLSVEDHIEVYAVNPDYPTSEQDAALDVDQYDVDQYKEGIFVLHFVDAETNRDLWFGWARGDVGPALGDAEKMREWVDHAVALVLKDLPLRGNGREP